MAKKDRFNGAVEAFGSQSTGLERTVFGDVTQSNDIDDNLNADFLRGWGIIGANDLPSKQDFNGMGFTLGELIAYLYQQGVPEWNAVQDYHLNQLCSSSGDVYKSLQDTNVNHAVSDGAWWSKITSTAAAPKTIQYLKTGTAATYTRPVGCKKIIVKMVGAGGGGAGGSGTNGGNGGDTLFNGIEADGGKGGLGTAVIASAGGGLGGDGGTGTADLRVKGSDGGTTGTMGGQGGSSPFGGAGSCVVVNGTPADANSGSGGGGGYTSSASAAGGGGGGAGEYVEFHIDNPAATYTFTVGAGGTGGPKGGSNGDGAAGGSGLIVVEEYY